MIHTLTLNPALDHILYLDRVMRNVTNRVQEHVIDIGGKGTHVSINLALMGVRSSAYGFAFGRSGQQILELLREAGVDTVFVEDPDHAENRSNYLLVETESKDATLIANCGPSPTKEHVAELFALLEQRVQDGDYVVLSGDASNFSDPRVYETIMHHLEYKNVRICLDASGDTLLRAVEAQPYLIKPNRDELSYLTKRELSSETELVQAICRLERQYHIPCIALSLGGDGVLAKIDDVLYRVFAPQAEVYNTVGCGDCLVAGLLYGLETQMQASDMLRYAAGCAAATAESPLSVGFDVQRAKVLAEQVRLSRI